MFSGEVYRWTDEKGTVHFTDDVSKIPEEYSKQAERIKVSEEIVKEAERTGKPEESSDRAKGYLEDLDRRIEVKRKLEKEISELEEELTLSQGRLKRIEEYEKEDFQYYLPFVGRAVPREPRLVGGVKEHNTKIINHCREAPPFTGGELHKRTGKLVPVASSYYDEKRRLLRNIGSIRAELRTLSERLLEIKGGL